MDGMAGRSKDAGGRILTVYFSRSGNTRTVAELVHGIVGGDVTEIVPVDPYPDEYEEVVKRGKRELASDVLPAIGTTGSGVPSLEDYGVVFLGSPNWFNTIAPPVRAFLAGADLSGKYVAPFVTHAGTVLGRTVSDLARICPRATLLEGLPVWGNRAGSARAEVEKWVRKIGIPFPSIPPRGPRPSPSGGSHHFLI